MESYFDWILQNSGLNHITIKIFKILDSKSLDKCLAVSGQWYQFIKQNESIWQQNLTIWKPYVSTDLPLHKACTAGHVNMVKLLIDVGFDLNGTNEYGKTPLYLACANKNNKVAKLLCQQPKFNVNGEPGKWWQRDNIPIFVAYMYNVELLYFLLKHPKIDVNIKDKHGMTLLMWTCFGTLTRHPEVVETLYRHPNIDINFKDFAGNTALHYACKHGKFEYVKLLLKHQSINFNILNNSGKTPLDLAKERQHLNIVDCFPLVESNKTENSFQYKTANCFILNYFQHFNRNTFANRNM